MSNKDMQHEALDRIYVVQTLLSNVLYDGEVRHFGLCTDAMMRLDRAMYELSEAYAAQSDVVFEEEENEQE